MLDTCVWGPSRRVLEAAGHDVIWSGDWEQDPGDEEILAHAYREGRILVTLDKDFGELVIVRGRPHPGIIRLVGFAAREQATICARILGQYGEELANGALITADPGRKGAPGAVEALKQRLRTEEPEPARSSAVKSTAQSAHIFRHRREDQVRP